jgi:hypothetical protein
MDKWTCGHVEMLKLGEMGVVDIFPSSPQFEKLVLYIKLLTILVIGLRKPYTKMEEGAGLELYDVY